MDFGVSENGNTIVLKDNVGHEIRGSILGLVGHLSQKSNFERTKSTKEPEISGKSKMYI